jgi:hypothetical protein
MLSYDCQSGAQVQVLKMCATYDVMFRGYAEYGALLTEQTRTQRTGYSRIVVAKLSELRLLLRDLNHIAVAAACASAVESMLRHLT